jgi:Mn2+/Fe2+ NRAMP family transporter
MSNRRIIQWLIPLLYGIAVGIFIAWGAEALLPARDVVAKYVSIFGTASLLVAVLLKSRTGYNWPWEGQAEWAEPNPAATNTYVRNLALWIVIVLLLLALFTLWQFAAYK